MTMARHPSGHAERQGEEKEEEEEEEEGEGEAKVKEILMDASI